MDFRFTEEEEKFRKEVREFMGAELPPEWQNLDRLDLTDEEYAFSRRFDRKLAEKGWLTMAWPREYGGQARSPIEQLIFNEERGYHRAPIISMQGVNMAGPTIMVHGTEEQKWEHLSRIARAEVGWCQGFTEPGAGSDLASLQCQAVADGDDYIIKGQKIFTSFAHLADWCYILVRTDPEAPKHRGISYLLMDMRSRGITVRPFQAMTGERLNEVFLDNVRVPKRNLVGEENRGWYVSMTGLGFERASVGALDIARLRRSFDELVRYFKERRRRGEALGSDAQLRHRLAELAIEIEVGRTMVYELVWMQGKGEISDYKGPMVKMYVNEVERRLVNIGVQVMGLYGSLQADSKGAPLKGRVEYDYMDVVGRRIFAGTVEVQHIVVATRGLGLPRG